MTMMTRSCKSIAQEVAAEAGLTLEELKSPSRERRVAWPRQEAMLRMLEAGASLPRAGRFFDRDHTTVLHAREAAQARRDQGVTFQEIRPVRIVDCRAIALEVALEAGLTLEELTSDSQTRRIAWPRQEAMLRMTEAGASTVRAGAFFGLDHTTAVHARKAAQARRYERLTENRHGAGCEAGMTAAG